MRIYSPPRLATPPAAVSAARPGALAKAAAGAAVALLALFLATYNLERYPTTWFDEGSHLHVPKALVQFGVYADVSAEGFRYFGPTTGVGPTVLLPIAAVFSVAGVGLVQARLVMVAYLLLALIGVALATRRLHGGRVALLAVGLLLVTPSVNLLWVGRQVLGEVPALAFLMFGFSFWTRAVDDPARRQRAVMWAGVAFGLMALTKNQFALILAPTLVFVFVADRLYYRSLHFAHVVVPLTCVVAGTALGQLAPLLPLLGTEQFGQTLTLARQASSGAIFVFTPARMLSGLRFVMSADNLAYWALPGLLYGVVLARHRGAHGLRHAFLAIFALIGLFWYVFGSIGWPRYAFPALAVAAILAARLLVDLMASAEHTGADAATRWRGLSIGCLVAVWLTSGVVAQARDIAGAADTSAQELAGYLDASVPRTVVIETWEPELGFLSDHAFHYPASGWLDRAVRAQWLARDGLPDYDPRVGSSPSYLVVGKFGKYTGIYRPFLERERPDLLVSIGDYDLYRLRERP